MSSIIQASSCSSGCITSRERYSAGSADRPAVGKGSSMDARSVHGNARRCGANVSASGAVSWPCHGGTATMPLMFLFRRPSTMPSPEDALPGRAQPIAITEPHHVNGASLTPPWPDGAQTAIFGMGCFWGAEKDFWTHARRHLDGRGLCRRLHAQPHVRGGLQRPDRPRRGRPRRLRPGARELRASCCASSGSTTTRRRACARATTRARSTARRSTSSRRSSRPLPRPLATPTRRS